MMWPPAVAALLGSRVCNPSRHCDASAPRALTLLLASREAPAQQARLCVPSSSVEYDNERAPHSNPPKALPLRCLVAWNEALCAWALTPSSWCQHRDRGCTQRLCIATSLTHYLSAHQQPLFRRRDRLLCQLYSCPPATIPIEEGLKFSRKETIRRLSMTLGCDLRVDEAPPAGCSLWPSSEERPRAPRWRLQPPSPSSASTMSWKAMSAGRWLMVTQVQPSCFTFWQKRSSMSTYASDTLSSAATQLIRTAFWANICDGPSSSMCTQESHSHPTRDSIAVAFPSLL